MNNWTAKQLDAAVTGSLANDLLNAGTKQTICHYPLRTGKNRLDAGQSLLLSFTVYG